MKTITLTLILICALSCSKSNESKAICWDCITKVYSAAGGNPGWHDYPCGKTEKQIRAYEKAVDTVTISGSPWKRQTTCYPKKTP